MIPLQLGLSVVPMNIEYNLNIISMWFCQFKIAIQTVHYIFPPSLAIFPLFFSDTTLYLYLYETITFVVYTILYSQDYCCILLVPISLWISNYNTYNNLNPYPIWYLNPNPLSCLPMLPSYTDSTLYTLSISNNIHPFSVITHYLSNYNDYLVNYPLYKSLSTNR